MPHSSDPPSAERARRVGQRLGAQERRLRLLLAHLAGRAVRARVELEDLAQEVFLRALASPRDLPAESVDEAALWALLQTLARQVVVDCARALRAQKRCGATLEPSHWSRVQPALEPLAGPPTQLASAESVRALTLAFLELPSEYRRVLGLRQFEGLSARAAAARLGRSEAAVHSLYRRALAAWHEVLAKNTDWDDESGPGLRLDRT